MCVPKPFRSITGKMVDQIYDHLQVTGFCRHILDNQFMNYMVVNNGKLRQEEDYERIMRIVESYLKNWRKEWEEVFSSYVLDDFYDFLQRLGALRKIRKKKHLSSCLCWLYYYSGIASLDEACRVGRLSSQQTQPFIVS